MPIEISELRSKFKLLLILAIVVSFSLPSQATSNLVNPSCNSASEKYIAVREDYLVSPKRTGQAYREVMMYLKIAERERKSCIKLINAQFKDELIAIKLRFDSLKADATSKREVREMQRRDEISRASAARDEAIKNIIVIPELPPRPSKKN